MNSWPVVKETILPPLDFPHLHERKQKMLIYRRTGDSSCWLMTSCNNMSQILWNEMKFCNFTEFGIFIWNVCYMVLIGVPKRAHPFDFVPQPTIPSPFHSSLFRDKPHSSLFTIPFFLSLSLLPSLAAPSISLSTTHTHSHKQHRRQQPHHY